MDTYEAPEPQKYGLSETELAELLGSFQEAVDMPYALTEPQAAAQLPKSRDREEADREQAIYRQAIESAAYLGGKVSLREAAELVRSEEAARLERALSTPSAPYTGITPGLREKSEQRLRDRGWL